jgi:hypothetical protein
VKESQYLTLSNNAGGNVKESDTTWRLMKAKKLPEAEKGLRACVWRIFEER